MCLTIQEYAEFFEVAPHVAWGAIVSPDCDGCDGMRPYGARHRSTIQRNIDRSIITLRKQLGIPFCPEPMTLVVDPNDCPVWLIKPVIAFGKKVEVARQVVNIRYNYRSACGDDSPMCQDFDAIGQAVVGVPEGWDEENWLVEFEYSQECSRTGQKLARPCFDYQCCGISNKYTNCPTTVDCVDLLEITAAIADPADVRQWILTIPGHLFSEDDYLSFWLTTSDGFTNYYGTAIAINGDDVTIRANDNTYAALAVDELVGMYAAIAHLVATWDKYQLVHPYLDKVAVIDRNCKRADEFVKRVEVVFYRVDGDQTIEPVARCRCNQCELCHTSAANGHPTYTYSYDEANNEFCFVGETNCTCNTDHRVRINYISGWNMALPEDIKALVILRAFLFAPGIRCGCEDHDRKLDWWAEIDPSTDNLPLANPNAWPYGRTRAGTELNRLLDAHNKSDVREGQRLNSAVGFFTGRRVKPGRRPVGRRG